MLNPEIKYPKTTYSIVVDNNRFPVDDFWINTERTGYVVVQNPDISNQLNVAFINNKYKKHYCDFQVWDYSRMTRTIWNLRLIDKKFVKDELNKEYTLFCFEYNYTHLEQLVAMVLSQNKARFLTQVPISGFLVDFYVPPDIIIEVDGPYHETDEQRKKDQVKDSVLRSLGFRVERINYFMLENLSFDLVSGDLLPISTDEEQCLEDLNTRINIILAKKNIKSDIEINIDKEIELQNIYDIDIYNDENFEDQT